MKLVAQLSLLVALTIPGLASAETYRWIDEAGTIHFTQNLSQVPSAQRPKAHVGATEMRGGVAIAAGQSMVVGRSEVQFQGEGHLMKVLVRLNDTITVPFYLDTGATELVVPERVADILGGEAVYTGQVTLNTPSGRIRVPTLQLDSVRIGQSEVHDLRASVSPSLEVGLLGGSFLNQFRYSVDPVTQTLILEPRSDRSRTASY